MPIRLENASFFKTSYLLFFLHLRQQHTTTTTIINSTTTAAAAIIIIFLVVKISSSLSLLDASTGGPVATDDIDDVVMTLIVLGDGFMVVLGLKSHLVELSLVVLLSTNKHDMHIYPVDYVVLSFSSLVSTFNSTV